MSAKPRLMMNEEGKEARDMFLATRNRLERFETAGQLVRDADLLEDYIRDDLLHEAQTGKRSAGMQAIIRLLATNIETRARSLRRCY